jgi:hypothetical protein
MSATPDLKDLLHRFEPITLAEMDAVKLQSRMDTKYVFRLADLPRILQQIMPEYRLLEVNGTRGVEYRSLYFDTPGRQHYLEHHNERTFRSKVRFREYVGSDLCYLEVKRKNGRGDTDKVRKRVPSIPSQLSAEQQAFVDRSSGCTIPLEPTLWNHFTRLTLVHRVRHERLTIDLGLTFSTDTDKRSLDGICVAELKESRAERGSPFNALMKSLGIRPAGMSKYCIGLLIMGLAPKHNNFKPVLLRLQGLQRAA